MKAVRRAVAAFTPPSSKTAGRRDGSRRCTLKRAAGVLSTADRDGTRLSSATVSYNGSMRLIAIVLAASLCAAAAPDGDAKQKIKAIKDFSRQGSTGIVSISGYLTDQTTEVRLEAVKAIVGIGGISTLDPLVTATRDNDPDIQERAVDGIVNFYLPGYVAKGWMSSVKHAGASVAGMFGDQNDQVIDPDTPVRPEITEAVIRLIGGAASDEARANAARAAGILRARAAVPALCASLKSKSDGLMFESLIALQKIRDTSSGSAAIFLVRDLNEKLQIAAIDLVGLLRTADAVPDLKRVVENGNKKPRRAALSALGQIADPSSLTYFEQYLNDKDDGMRAAAAEGIGRVGVPADRALVQPMFQGEKRTSLRLSLAFALVGLGEVDEATDGPLRYLSSNLTSRSWKGVASPFLAELARKPQVRAVIHQMLGSLGDKDELMGLAGVLAISGGKDSIGPLEQLSRSSDAEVAKEAIRAIRIINTRI
jgi:HEAT repeat protein